MIKGLLDRLEDLNLNYDDKLTYSLDELELHYIFNK